MFKNPPLSSGRYLITEKRKVNKRNLHTKLQLKEKDSTSSYQYISSSLVSTEVDPMIKI